MAKVPVKIAKAASNTVKTGLQTMQGAAETAVESGAAAIKAVVDGATSIGAEVMDGSVKVIDETSNGLSQAFGEFTKSLDTNSVLQYVCILFLGIILIMMNSSNAAVSLFRRWWVRMIAMIILILVLFAEGDSPRCSILLGLVFVALILFSDMPPTSDESFYGKVPSSMIQDSEMTVEEEEAKRTEQQAGHAQQVQQEPEPVDMSADYSPLV